MSLLKRWNGVVAAIKAPQRSGMDSASGLFHNKTLF